MIKYRFYSATVTKELPPGSNSGREFLGCINNLLYFLSFNHCCGGTYMMGNFNTVRILIMYDWTDYNSLKNNHFLDIA